MGNRGAEGGNARLDPIAECSNSAAASEHRDLSCAEAVSVSAVHSQWQDRKGVILGFW